jgi:hypothetical protein
MVEPVALTYSARRKNEERWWAMRCFSLLALGAAQLALAMPAHAQEAVSSLIAQTTSYETLTITAGHVPTAPAGKLLTLSVDSVETPLIPGTYLGKVVLSVTDDIPVQYHQLPIHHFRTGLYVDSGVPVAAKSVSAVVQGARQSDGVITDARIASVGERFNGIIVTGEGKYTIDHPVIDLTGNGGNDFAGFGAAIMSTGKADVTVLRPIIRTHGAIRPALFVGGDSILRIEGAEIEVRNGTLPPDYTFTVDVGRMMEVPWMLGLSGNVRTSNLVDRGTLYISNSHIRSQAWGVLSTDDNSRVRMFVKDSLIEAMEAGYGTYSIGNSINSFTHSVIRAADIGAIMAAEGSVTFTDHTLVEAGLYGVMMHSGTGGGTLTIDKDSVLRAGKVAIEVKGIGTTIIVDSASVTARGGTILQAMENDDPFMKAMMSGHPPPGMGPPPPGMGPTGGHPGDKPQSPEIIGTFRNTSLMGDFWNGRTKEGGMTLRFENASVVGRISTSTTAPVNGKEPVRETYREIGSVINTATPSKTGKGLALSLDGRSRWSVTGLSYLTRLEIAPGARVDGGVRKVSIAVNGRKVVLKPGKYEGAITLSVE